MIKYIIKKYFLSIGLIVSSINGFSQTGINTTTPDQSSVLDINATNKGVLMPKYTLISLTDSTFPINNPLQGTLIYNIGGTYEKGYYYWDGNKWDKMIVTNEMDQIFNIKIPINESSGANNTLIPASAYTSNNVNFTSYSNRTVISTIEGAAVTSENISLPAGKYKVDITLTASAPSSTFNSNNRLFPHSTDPNISLDLYGIDAELLLGTTSITPMKYASTISGTGSHNDIQGYRYYFVFELTNAATNIRLNLKQATGRTNDQVTNLAHTGLMVSFRRFLE